MKRHKTAVIGLGNYLLADEGAGIHAVQLLEAALLSEDTDPPPVDVIEGGTPGYELLHQFEEREKIIFIDAGNCGLKPGEFTRFTPAEVLSRRQPRGYSLHEFDLIGFLQFAGSLDKTRNVEIVIYCIQPAEIKMTEKLSPAVKNALPFLVKKVYNEIKQGSHHA